MFRYLKEAAILVLLIAPLIYLSAIWRNLPERVPTHFSEGVADDWSTKMGLLYITMATQFGIYLLLLLPVVFPRIKTTPIGNYYNVRLVVTIMISLLMFYCLHASYSGKM